MRILDYVKPTELSRVARLQVLARQIVEGYCTGRHRSPHKGFSVEFKEHRQYVQGDELKNIDQRVDEGVYAALSVDASVAARNSHGGTAPEQVRERVAEARRALEDES